MRNTSTTNRKSELHYLFLRTLIIYTDIFWSLQPTTCPLPCLVVQYSLSTMTITFSLLNRLFPSKDENRIYDFIIFWTYCSDAKGQYPYLMTHSSPCSFLTYLSMDHFTFGLLSPLLLYQLLLHSSASAKLGL